MLLFIKENKGQILEIKKIRILIQYPLCIDFGGCRNHIKQLNAVHSNDLVTINKLLTEENTKLKEKINVYETQVNNYSIQLSESEKLKSLLTTKSNSFGLILQ